MHNPNPIVRLVLLHIMLAFHALVMHLCLGASGTIIFNKHTPPHTLSVHAISADGSNMREIPINLPSPTLPEVSRDGRSMLVSSGGPFASVMLSQNVYHLDLSSGNITPITHYFDTTSDGVTVVTNDSGQTEFGHYSYYTTHLPNHKAFSPSGDRAAALDLSAVSGREPGGIRLAAVQAPVLEVYRVQQDFPLGDRLITGSERTTVNQAGDGLDWHPAREELVAPFRWDIPSSSNIGDGLTEGTVITVFATSGLNPVLRKLTTPTGRSYYDFNNFYIQSELEQDYAPAISPDGSKVAYVRNTLASDSRLGPGIWLDHCTIRIINYDGSGDRELVRFGNNLWISKLAWSPDNTEIAFDIAPRLVSNGLELQLGDLEQSEIYIVRVSDTTIRLLTPAPSAYPTWSPLGFAPEPIQQPQFRVSRQDNQIRLQLSNLKRGQQYSLESTIDLKRWTTAQSLVATETDQNILIPITSPTKTQFFRVNVR